MAHKVYTRTGDKGETRLADGRTIRKASTQIMAVGMVDELNASIGVAIAGLGTEQPQIAEVLLKVQHELFDLGAALSYVGTSKTDKVGRSVAPGLAAWLEAEMDTLSADLPPLRSFVLPGGCPAGAQLHYARTLCRRTELISWKLHEESEGGVPADCLTFLNRLADYLFVAARYVNCADGGEVFWEKGAK